MQPAKRFLENVQFNEKQNFLLFAVNPKIFPLPAVFSAAYVMLDQAFVLVDGSPETQVVVSMQPKKGNNLRGLAAAFSEQLLNYAVSHAQSSSTRQIREELLKRVFLTQTSKGEK